jgi:hypothetical protein
MLPKDGFSFDRHDHKTGKKNSQTQHCQARSPKSLKGQSCEDIVHSALVCFWIGRSCHHCTASNCAEVAVFECHKTSVSKWSCITSLIA